MTMSVCTTHGCPWLVEKPGPCILCARKKERARGSAAQRGYDQKWQRLQTAYLKLNPWCVACGAPSTDADHKITRRSGGSDAFENLQPMCHSCHSKKTATEDGGFGRRPVTPPTPPTTEADDDELYDRDDDGDDDDGDDDDV